MPTLVLGIFLLVGLGGVLIFGLGTWQRFETRSWAPVPAQILASGVHEKEDRDGHRSFEVAVRYTYEWQGVKRESGNFSRPNQTYAHRDEVRKLIEHFPAGAKVDCRVNPEHPQSAVLRPDDLAFGWLTIIPVLIATFAACGLIGTWSAAGSTPSRVASLGFGVAFSSLSLAIGVGVLIGIFWPDVSRGGATNHWVQTPCTITASDSEVFRGDHDGGATVRARVEYRYTYGGEEYVGDRIRAVNAFTTNNRENEMEDRFAPGSQTVCYVNPRQPGEAVLVPGMISPWISGLFSLFFIGLGGWLISGAARDFRKG
jgi:hypothetical protein